MIHILKKGLDRSENSFLLIFNVTSLHWVYRFNIRNFLVHSRAVTCVFTKFFHSSWQKKNCVYLVQHTYIRTLICWDFALHLLSHHLDDRRDSGGARANSYRKLFDRHEGVVFWNALGISSQFILFLEIGMSKMQIIKPLITKSRQFDTYLWMVNYRLV